ncbi:MAG TPA: hypothetical protein VI215_12175 [Bacteroidota bacterium]|jgi:hypothetical protein
MSRGPLVDHPIVVRLVISLLMGVAAAGLFFLNRTSLTPPRHGEAGPVSASSGLADTTGHPGEQRSEPVPEASPAVLAEIDHEVDSVLVHFGIDESWTRRKEIAVPNSRFSRIERRVLIPKDLATVVLNGAFNAMAARFNGRAIASENLRENHVTIHIEVGGAIVQTIILRPTPNLRRDARDRPPKKV